MVLFPAPGGPVMPMRKARPVFGNILRRNSAAPSSSFSTAVIARAIARRSPSRRRSMSTRGLAFKVRFLPKMLHRSKKSFFDRHAHAPAELSHNLAVVEDAAELFPL